MPASRSLHQLPVNLVREMFSRLTYLMKTEISVILLYWVLQQTRQVFHVPCPTSCEVEPAIKSQLFPRLRSFLPNRQLLLWKSLCPICSSDHRIMTLLIRLLLKKQETPSEPLIKSAAPLT